MIARLLIAALLVSAATTAHADLPSERLSDPALEDRARELFREIRCVVCQNQSIVDSNATIAKDLRIIVREQVAEGQSDEAILSFLTERYGDFVLLKPPFRVDTLLLWLTPVIVLLLGGGLAVMVMRRHRAIATPAALSKEEEARLAKIMEQDRS